MYSLPYCEISPIMIIRGFREVFYCCFDSCWNLFDRVKTLDLKLEGEECFVILSLTLG